MFAFVCCRFYSITICDTWLAFQLDKLYDPDAEEDDQEERYEEMNRMREHVMAEIDKNKDRMVSLEEFVESTNRASFADDEPWEVCSHDRACVMYRLCS